MDEQTESKEAEREKVGYRKPPKHSRFKPGRSGNPSGRPRGTVNMVTILERTLREKVVINENGRRKSVTKLEAALKQVMNKAASGDLKALQLLTSLVRSAEDRAIQAPVSSSSFTDADKKVVAQILNRMEAAMKGAQEHEN